MSLFNTNIKHPKLFSRVTGSVGLVTELEAISQSLRVLFTTAKGELFGDPDYGCRLYEFMFELEGEPLYQMIREDLVDTARKYEPRVFLQESDITIVEDATTLRITVKYNIRYTDLISDFSFLIQKRKEVY